MTYVSRGEAEHFCQWLTSVERAKGLLEAGQEYRLPTDDEWSMAAGLPRERGNSPGERSGRIEGVYPWGYSWPPIPVSANLWDAASVAKGKRPAPVTNYLDGFGDLAPVASLPANEGTLHDLAGNVWEWVREDYGGTDEKQRGMGALRGGSWRTAEREEMLASYRRPMPVWTRSDEIGFRVVLSARGTAAREDE